jgi:hypothetical protein
MEDTAATKKRKPAGSGEEEELVSSDRDDLKSMSLDDLNKLLNEVLMRKIIYVPSPFGTRLIIVRKTRNNSLGVVSSKNLEFQILIIL